MTDLSKAKRHTYGFHNKLLALAKTIFQIGNKRLKADRVLVYG